MLFTTNDNILSMQFINRKYFSIILLIIYFCFRYYPLQNISSSAYFSYALEVVVSFSFFIIHREKLKFIFLELKNYKSLLILNFIIGVLLFCVEISPLAIQIPFDLTQSETIIFLLVVAPVLEEFIFRFFVWHTIAQFSNGFTSLIVTSCAFSLSHFYSYWFVPNDYHPFIFYQSLYTLILSYFWGRAYLKSGNNLAVPIGAHFLLNLGFYIGSLIIRS